VKISILYKCDISEYACNGTQAGFKVKRLNKQMKITSYLICPFWAKDLANRMAGWE